MCIYCLINKIYKFLGNNCNSFVGFYRKVKPSLWGQVLDWRRVFAGWWSCWMEMGYHLKLLRNLRSTHLVFPLELSKTVLPFENQIRNPTKNSKKWNLFCKEITYSEYNGISCGQSNYICAGDNPRTFSFQQTLYTLNEIEPSKCQIWCSILLCVAWSWVYKHRSITPLATHITKTQEEFQHRSWVLSTSKTKLITYSDKTIMEMHSDERCSQWWSIMNVLVDEILDNLLSFWASPSIVVHLQLCFTRCYYS